MQVVWLICAVATATSVSLAFNINTTVHIFTKEPKDFFRNKVLQLLSDKNKRTLVPAPEQLKGPEETCTSDLNMTHHCLIIPEISPTDTPIPFRHFGLWVSEDSTSSQITVCSPSVEHPHYENSSVSKVCYKMTDHHQQLFPVDLVFLFDGSNSMTEAEFSESKDFMVEMMNSLKNTSIKFAAVQFSTTVNKVFDFNDYEDGSALEKLMNEKHLRSLTHTYRALDFVLREILENPAAGASPDATKVLVLITDGDPSDLDRNGIVKKYDDKNITRLVIGIKDAKLEKFRAIASEPKDKHAFKIENYDGLTGVLENFQKKIFVMEGSKVARAGDITDELSQSGFSTVFNKVCSPPVARESSDSSYLNTVCHKITNQQSFSFPPVVEEHTNKTVDLVFLFDGSNSMSEAEFNKNKEFIVEMMNSLKNTSVKFAAVQFSTTVNKVFDFNDYEDGSALEKLMYEKRLRSLTNTYRALDFVLREILENPAAGASPDATKVLVLITDGAPSDLDRNRIIERYDEKNIIRIVIGVRDARLEKFMRMASEPRDKNTFKMENYDGLTGVLQNVVNKAFDLEVCRGARAGDTTDELSQSGFSAVFRKDILVVGSVGSNSWRSSLHKHREQMQVDSYLGNSISIGEKNGVALYFTGAPVFASTGQVVLFRHRCDYWTAVQRISGDQIGSYFGAELRSFDVDSDGNTDFLLVGAPLFHLPHEKKEGRIYIYSLTERMLLESNQDVMAPSMGRFGTTISSLADLNGDGLRDVAVGAPLEDLCGVVYIYHGHRQRGISSTFSQKIVGININHELRFFGKAIVGELGEDGLPSVVIGSRDAAVVFTSKPVFNVLARVSCHPEGMSTENLDCLSPDIDVPVAEITACFEMEEATRSKPGAVNSALNITYTLTVTGQRHQDSFSQTFELRDENTCSTYSINLPNFVEDTSSPLRIRLNFFQPDSESATGVLNVDMDGEAVLEIPFKNKC